MLKTLHHPDGRIAHVEPFQVDEFAAAGFVDSAEKPNVPAPKPRKPRANKSAPSPTVAAQNDDDQDDGEPEDLSAIENKSDLPPDIDSAHTV